jgi:hypothetical protein
MSPNSLVMSYGHEGDLEVILPADIVHDVEDPS